MPTTRVLKIDPAGPDRAAVEEAAGVIRGGGLVAIPTETVYGLAADATRVEAVRRIYSVKGRPSTNPLIVHVADVNGARRVAAVWPAEAQRLAEAFWPGPLTLVVRRAPGLPDEVCAGLGTVGLRVPATLVARLLIERAGVPLAAPSANRSNRVSPTTAEHVLEQLDGQIELVLDAGPTSIGLESTVLEVSAGPPYRILRPGPISAEALRDVLGPVVEEGPVQVPAFGAATSPGQLARHYAPETPAFRLEFGAAVPRLNERRVAVLTFGPGPLGPCEAVPVLGRHLPTPEEAAAGLYEALHTCDRAAVDLILVRMPPEVSPWRAIRDRLTRATRPWGEDSGPSGLGRKPVGR